MDLTKRYAALPGWRQSSCGFVVRKSQRLLSRRTRTGPRRDRILGMFLLLLVTHISTARLLAEVGHRLAASQLLSLAPPIKLVGGTRLLWFLLLLILFDARYFEL